MQDLGIPFVYVTHNQEEALTLSDRIAVMHEGRIEQVGPSSRSITVRRPGLSPGSSARRTACTRASPSRTATMPDWRDIDLISRRIEARVGDAVDLFLKPERIRIMAERGTRR